MFNTRFTRAFGAALTLLVLTACSGSKDGTGPGQTTASISLSTAAVAVTQSGTATGTITVGRVNFSGDVSLTAEGLPAGMTATFAPASVSGPATTATVEIAATAAVPVGTSSITVRAHGTGVTDATTSLAVTVSSGATNPSVTLDATPSSATLVAGRATTSAVAITRSGGAAGVTMTITGAPTGMTTSLSSANPVTAASLTMSIATLASVIPGTYTLTVHANAAGMTEATTTFALTVEPPPPNNAVWQFCDPARYPLWFAVQDGATGVWTPVAPTTPGQYPVGYGQPQVGIAAVFSDRGVVTTEVRYFATAEVAAGAAAECTANPTPGTKSISGTITGFASLNENANVAIGNKASSVANLTTPAFTISRVQSGPRDLMAGRTDVGTGSVVRMLLLRSQDIPDGGSTGVLDIGGGASFAPATGTVTITAPNDGGLVGRTVFTTALGTGAQFTAPSLSSGVAATYQGVPLAVMIASDLQHFDVVQAVGTTITRSISRYMRGPAAISMSMPTDPGSPTLTSIPGAAYPRATASGSSPAAFNAQMAIEFDQAGAGKRWVIYATAGVRNGSTSYSFTMPDFSALPQWSSAWALGTGAADVTTSFSGQTGANASGQPIDGTVLFTTSRRVTFTF